jgi:putative FmdB family regulatory protein
VPLYEYECKSCHTKTERIQKFSDPPLTECPHCGGELEQLLSAPAVQFKGAGWYVTDYARKGSGGGSKDEKGSSDSGTKSSSETASSPSGSSSSEGSKPGGSTGSEKK